MAMLETKHRESIKRNRPKRRVGLRRPGPARPSKDKETSYFDIREDDELDEAQLASWVKQAAALPGWVP